MSLNIDKNIIYKKTRISKTPKFLTVSEIRSRKTKNVIEVRSFAEMIEKSIIRYHNKSIELKN